MTTPTLAAFAAALDWLETRNFSAAVQEVPGAVGLVLVLNLTPGEAHDLARCCRKYQASDLEVLALSLENFALRAATTQGQG